MNRSDRFKNRRAIRLAAIVFATAVLATACGGGEDASSANDAVANLTGVEKEMYEAAQDEPDLTWYSAQIPELDEATIKAFEDRYPGLKVDYLRLASSELSTRYAQERSAGSDPAGLVTNADPNLFSTGADKGWFETELDLPSIDSWPAEYYSDGVAKVGILPYYLSYNTDKVSEDEAPTGWEDLTDPKFRGRITMGDPRASFSYVGLAQILRDTYGDDYLRSLAEQHPTLVPSIVPGNESLASGAADILVPNVRSIVDPLIEKGAPIKVIEVSPTTGSEYLTAVATDTASPSSAKLLMNFLLTEDGQALFNGDGGSTPLGQVGDTIPLPDGYQSPPLEAAAKNRTELLDLLGIDE